MHTTNKTKTIKKKRILTTFILPTLLFLFTNTLYSYAKAAYTPEGLASLNTKRGSHSGQKRAQDGKEESRVIDNDLCGYLKLKDIKERNPEMDPYPDYDKKTCVVPVRTNPERTIVYYKTVSVDYDKTFGEYEKLFKKAFEAEQEKIRLETKYEKLKKHMDWLLEEKNWLDKNKYASNYQEELKKYNKAMESYAIDQTELENIQDALEKAKSDYAEFKRVADDEAPYNVNGQFQYRGSMYPYYQLVNENQEIVRSYVLLFIPDLNHGGIEEIKDNFASAPGFMTLGKDMTQMLNTVSAAMHSMDNVMAGILKVLTEMLANISDMTENIKNIKRLTEKVEEMANLMSQLNQNVGGMNHNMGNMTQSVGSMGSMMSNPMGSMMKMMNPMSWFGG